MTVSVSRCPVPPEQQPLNEFKTLQSSWFFGWCNASLTGYLTRLGIIWLAGGLLILPIVATSFDPTEVPAKFLLVGSVGALFLPTLVLIRLMLGWAYVYRRLHAETIVYEETGWYDGQSWTKPQQECDQNRLISSYEVQPILQRLRYSFGCLGLIGMVSSILWQLL